LKSLGDQYDKLKKSMVGVLNFRPGNEPTSLTQILRIHQDLKVSDKELDVFHLSFLKTIDEQFKGAVMVSISAATKCGRRGTIC
jgi:hypothetical protein